MMPSIRGPYVLCSAEELPMSPPAVRYQYRLPYLTSPFLKKWEETIRVTGLADGTWEWMVDGYRTWGRQDTAEEAVNLAIAFVGAEHNLPSGTFTLA